MPRNGAGTRERVQNGTLLGSDTYLSHLIVTAYQLILMFSIEYLILCFSIKRQWLMIVTGPLEDGMFPFQEKGYRQRSISIKSLLMILKDPLMQA
jgi:hypothetical protein